MFHLAYLVVRKALTLLSDKAAEEGHRDEAEGDNEEDSATNHTLGLWAVGDQ